MLLEDGGAVTGMGGGKRGSGVGSQVCIGQRVGGLSWSSTHRWRRGHDRGWQAPSSEALLVSVR